MIPGLGIITVDIEIIIMDMLGTILKSRSGMEDRIIIIIKNIKNITEKKIKPEQSIIKKCTSIIDITADIDKIFRLI